jgi:phage tail-like protein
MSDLLLTTFAFHVEMEGIDIATFKEASGFESTSEVIEYKEANQEGRLMIKKVPGSLSWSDITLRRAISSSLALWEWRKQVLDGDIEGARRDGSIVLYDSTGEEVVRYNFVRGWVSQWKGPDVDADQNEIAVEEVTIAHEGLERAE